MVFLGFQDNQRGYVFWDPTSSTVTYTDVAKFPGSTPKPFIPTPSSIESIDPALQSVELQLGETPMDEICNEQDSYAPKILDRPNDDLPSSMSHALSKDLRHIWGPPLRKEINQLFDMDVWEAVKRTPGMKVIGAKYVFTLKHKPDGSVDMPKARYVAKGFCQRLGVDCYKTFAPTASLSSPHLLFAIAVSNRWGIKIFDISAAYLHSPIDKLVYVEPPTDVQPKLAGKAMLLKKSLYGTRQAACSWWKVFKGLLNELGFAGDCVEQTVYIYRREATVVVI